MHIEHEWIYMITFTSKVRHSLYEYWWNLIQSKSIFGLRNQMILPTVLRFSVTMIAIMV